MHQISVWFVCKLCRSSFKAVPDLVMHKFESHFEQFKSVKHIIFEERVDDGDFETFADGDILSTGESFIDESRVDWNRCADTDIIQRQHVPLNNVAHITEDAVFEDTKPFNYSSPNSDLLDNNIGSRAVSFTIEKDSVIINVGTLNNPNSTSKNPKQTTRSQHIINEETPVCNAAARIKNPFVLLRRLSPKEIESARLSNKNVTKCIQSNSDIVTTDTTHHFDSDFDQLSVNSDQAGTMSDHESDIGSNVKPLKLIEATTVTVPESGKKQFTCPRRKCNRVYQLQRTLTKHIKNYHGDASMRRRWLVASGSQPSDVSSDEDNGDTLVPVPVPAPVPAAVAVAVADWAIKETKTSTLIDADKAQDQCKCPIPKCGRTFSRYNKSTLAVHIRRHQRANNTRMRRRMLAASSSPTHGNNEDKHGDTPKFAHAEWSTEEADAYYNNEIEKLYDIPPVPVTLLAMETSTTINFDEVQLTQSENRIISNQDHYNCTVPKCGKTFYTKSDLYRHISRCKRAYDIRIRHKMLTASSSPTHGNNTKEDDGYTLKLAE